MPRKWRLFTAVLGCLIVSACGQKGPLYLPGPPQPPSSPRPADMPAPASPQQATEKK
ncbi:MAG: LPS translocon maturation chaperone LptM [Burkholderiales bacterium]